MSDFVEGMQTVLDADNYKRRTVVPGLVVLPVPGPTGLVADFQTGIADLVDGLPSLPDISPDAPVMIMTSGGFYTLMPVQAGDEMLGLVVDRATGEWRSTRVPGQADVIHGKRSKTLHDIVLTPYAMSPPEGAPATWDHYIVGGLLGPAIEVGLDASITLTKQGVEATLSTFEMDALGSVAITVPIGQLITLGNMLAEALTKVARLEANMAAMLNAGSAVPPSPLAGNNGSLAFTAAKTAWDIAVAANPMGTTILLGE